MTEKEKAEAYDEAIERAKKLYGNGIIEEIFPELKESKDKKIREAILKGLIDCRDAPDLGWSNFGGIHIDNCIAWLEKQGKKSSWKPSKEEMDVLYSLSYITNEYDEYKEYVITHLYQDLKREFFNDSSYENMFSLDNKEDDVRRRSTIQVLEYVRSLDAYNQYGKADIDKNIAWLEKQGKNSTDKTKPSFKVGDWIIIDDTSYCDEQCRFWTIEDAKDGDVLALSWLEDKNLWEKIIIFKKYHSEGVKGICSIPCVEGYGNTFKNGKLAFTDEEVPYYSKTWTCNLHPATKEQRDLLFQKIKEAGYEWDDDKKELKKLVEPKFKVGDKITNTFRKYVGASGSQAIISEITEDKYIFTDGSYIFISNQDSWELAPDKNPKFDTETLKTYNDINIGDTVYIWGSGDSSVDETTITEKYDDRDHWNLKFSNGCVGRALKNGTSSTMGMYACLVYSDKEAVRESINERIKILSNIKI